MDRKPAVPPMRALSATARGPADLAMVDQMAHPDGEALTALPSADVTDVELVEQVLAGDADAFGGIVARYPPPRVLDRLPRRRPGRRRPRRRAGGLHPGVPLAQAVRLLAQLLHLVLPDRDEPGDRRPAQATQRARHGPRRASADRLPSDVDTVGPVEQKETRGLVWDVLNKMDGKFKSVLVLRDIHGMSCREIAPILQVTHATVRWAPAPRAPDLPRALGPDGQGRRAMKAVARCVKVRPLLALAASQDLGERASRRVWSHLAECMDCRRRYTRYLELRSALTELEPKRPGMAGAAGLESDFFDGLQRDILDRVEQEPPAVRGRRAWAGASAAAALFLVGALTIQAWLPHGDRLLHRDPIAPMAPVVPANFEPDFGTVRTPPVLPAGARRAAADRSAVPGRGGLRGDAGDLRSADPLAAPVGHLRSTAGAQETRRTWNGYKVGALRAPPETRKHGKCPFRVSVPSVLPKAARSAAAQGGLGGVSAPQVRPPLAPAPRPHQHSRRAQLGGSVDAGDAVVGENDLPTRTHIDMTKNTQALFSWLLVSSLALPVAAQEGAPPGPPEGRESQGRDPGRPRSRL